MRKLEDVIGKRLGRKESDIKKARLSIRNGLVKARCLNPKKEVGRDFKWRLKSNKSNLSREGLWLLKSTPLKNEDRFWPSSRKVGKKVELGWTKGWLRRKPRESLWQRDFYKSKNVLSFYGLKKRKVNRLGTVFYRDNESRLDVLLVRLGYCSNLNEAKLCVRRGYVSVDKIKVKCHTIRVNAFSTIEVCDTKLPFKLLHTEFLSNFPKPWRYPRLCLRLKKRKEVLLPGVVECGSKKDSKVLDLLGYLRKKNKGFQKSKFKYLKKVVYKGSFTYPIHDLSDSVCRVSESKFLVSSKNRKVRVPRSLSI